jgi:chromosome segregation ATPase
MATINQANAQMNEVIDGMAQELEEAKLELTRKEDYISRMNHHFDTQLGGLENTKEALQKEKEALQQEKATVQNLVFKVSSLEEEVGEQAGKNDQLTDKNAELVRQLAKVKAKYIKSREAKKKMEKLRIHWAGIANTFGADIKQDEDEDSDISEAD